jgi:hypothetical protein
MTDPVELRFVEMLSRHARPDWVVILDDPLDRAFVPSPLKVGNSKQGYRLFSSFIDDVQMEYGICFSYQELERSRSVANWIELTRQRMGQQPARVLQAVRKRMLPEGPWFLIATVLLPVALSSIVLVPLWLFGAEFQRWLALAIAVLVGLRAIPIAVSDYREREYWRSLEARVRERM